MFAVRIDQNEELYRQYGCYLKDEVRDVQEMSIVNNDKPNRVMVLSPQRQIELHRILERSMKKTETGLNYRIKPEFIVQMLIGADVVLNIKDKKEYGEATKSLTNVRGVVIRNRVDKDKPDDINWKSIIEVRKEIKKVAAGKKVHMVWINDIGYQTQIPDYVSSIIPLFRSNGCSYQLKMDGRLVSQKDPYFSSLFKQRKPVSDLSGLNVANVTSCIIQPNVSSLADYVSVVSAAQRLNASVTQNHISKLTFSSGNRLASYIPFKEALSYQESGATFGDLFKLMVATCVCDPEPVYIHKSEVIVKVTSIVPLLRSFNAKLVSGKIKAEIDKIDAGKQRVNIVVVANKGSGKSTFTSLLSTVIQQKYNRDDVKVISSDAYGRWLTYVSEKYNDILKITKQQEEELLNEVSYAQYEMLDTSDKQSWFTIQAAKLLSKWQITTLQQYHTLHHINRAKLFSEMNEILAERLRTGSIISYSKYNVKLEAEIAGSSICIYECHFTEETTQVARSQIIFRLRPIIQTKLTLIERAKEGSEFVLAEVLLHDVYKTLIGSTNPLVYASEILDEVTS